MTWPYVPRGTFHRVVALALPPVAPRASEVLYRLGSADPAERAWGAFLASAFRVSEAGPSLQALLEVAAHDPRYDYRELANITDALLQLDEAPSPSTLRALVVGRTDALLLMLLRPAENSEGLLAVSRDDEREVGDWFAATHALVELRSRPVVADLYQSLLVNGTLHVNDRMAGTVSGTTHGAVGCSFPEEWPAAYPPAPHYALTVDCAADEECVPVIRRRWRGAGSASCGWASTTPAEEGREYYAPRLLARLLDGELRSLALEHLSPALTENVVLREPRSLLSAVAKLEQKFQRTHDRVGEALAKQGLVASQAPLPIHWCVRDDRRDKRKPLPVLPNQLTCED